MNQVYIYDGSFDKGDLGWMLVREAASRCGFELDLPYDFEEAEIRRTDKGKPFFVDIPVEFSLSHSGVMWMCMFSDRPCGLDLQVVEEKRDYTKIVKHRYTPEEQHYVDLWGREGFYDIWVRKEAFGKCMGTGIFSDMPSMVDEKTDLKAVLEWKGLCYDMQALDISPEMKCALCIIKKQEQPEQIELRILG